MEVCGLRAGVGKIVIELPSEFFPQENFYKVQDDIHVRIVILEGNKKIALVSLELTSLPATEVELLKDLVNSITEILPENIWICVTHSFSSPHFLPPHMLKDEEAKKKMKILRQAIHSALHKGVELALGQMKEAKLGVGYSKCDININRDMLTKDGWWLGSDSKGRSDKTLTVFRIDEKESSMTDRPIAVLYHYNVQSSVMDGVVDNAGKKMVTSDLVGRASDFIERNYEGRTVAMFLLGAAGDQAPIKKARSLKVDGSGNLQEEDLGEKGFEFVSELGEILGKETLKIAQKVEYEENTGIMTGQREFTCPGQEIPTDIHSLYPTFTYEYKADEERTMSVEAIKLGEIVLLGTRPELNAKTAEEIKKASPFSKTLVMTMVNGGAKYMADKDSYDKNTYEAMNSSFGKGSAEILTENAVKLLREIKN